MNNKGFTMIELLAAVLILGILATVALPNVFRIMTDSKADKYIDDAFLAGLKTVHIIHGRGEGILRSGLRQELSHNKHVKSFKSAPYNDGGEGCTIAELKDSKSELYDKAQYNEALRYSPRSRYGQRVQRRHNMSSQLHLPRLPRVPWRC